jgi:hypothetical protein
MRRGVLPGLSAIVVAMQTPALPDALRAHLSQAARWDAEYGSNLSNHLPMALTALARLGASDERLTSFAAHYAKRLQAMPPEEPWPCGDAWRAHLGRPRAWPLYRSLWREWIAHEGAADVLQQALPALMQGAGAVAFHGPIRTAYALAANHADELIDALAYWSCRWFACGVADGDSSHADTQAVLAELDFAAELPRENLIANAMARAAAHPRFAPVIARWRVDVHTTLPRLAMLAAERYATHGGFAALHLMTSAHAMRVLLPWLDADDRRDALRHYAAAAAAAWATLPRNAVPAPALPSLRWDEVVWRAIAIDDDGHACKLVDSARELEAALGGAVWLRAATRAVAIAARG